MHVIDPKALDEMIKKTKHALINHQAALTALEALRNLNNASIGDLLEAPELLSPQAHVGLVSNGATEPQKIKVTKTVERDSFKLSADQWAEVVTKKPQGVEEIYQAAIVLYPELAKQSKAVFKGRLYPSLANLVAAKKIKAKGPRGKQVYYR